MTIGYMINADKANHPDLHAETVQLVDQVKTAHSATPFADAWELSSWMHRTWKNPRLDIRTDANGRRMVIGYRTKNLLENSTAYSELTILTLTLS